MLFLGCSAYEEKIDMDSPYYRSSGLPCVLHLHLFTTEGLGKN
jgi:hypothetical protein